MIESIPHFIFFLNTGNNLKGEHVYLFFKQYTTPRLTLDIFYTILP